MANITLNNGHSITAPDGLTKDQYDEIVTDAYSKLGGTDTPAPTNDVGSTSIDVSDQVPETTGDKIKNFFRPAVDTAINTVEGNGSDSGVGGFMSSVNRGITRAGSQFNDNILLPLLNKFSPQDPNEQPLGTDESGTPVYPSLGKSISAQDQAMQLPNKFEAAHPDPLLSVKGVPILPPVGKLASSIGQYLPEMIASAGVGPAVSGLTPNLIPSVQRALSTGVGAALGGLSKGDPTEAATNSLTFPAVEAGMEFAGKPVSAALQGLKSMFAKAPVAGVEDSLAGAYTGAVDPGQALVPVPTPEGQTPIQVPPGGFGGSPPGQLALPPKYGTTDTSVIPLPDTFTPPVVNPIGDAYGPGIGNFGVQKFYDMANKADVNTMDPATYKALFPDKALPKGMPEWMPETQTGQKFLPAPEPVPPTFSGPGSIGEPTNTHPGTPYNAKQAMVAPLPDNYYGKPGNTGVTPPTVPDQFRAEAIHPDKSLIELAAQGNQNVEKSLYEFHDTRPPSYEGLSADEKVKYWESGKPAPKTPKRGVTEGVGAVTSQIRAVKSVLKDMGEKGQEIWNRARAAREDHMSLMGQWNTQTNQIVRGASNEDFAMATKILEGQQNLAGTTPKQRQMAEAIKGLFTQIRDTAQQAIPEFKGLNNYFPHKGTDDFYNKLTTKFGEAEYKKFLLTKVPGASEEELGLMVQKMLSRDRGFKFGNIADQRLDLIPENYIRRDKAVIWEYLDNAARYIAEQKHLGKDSSILTSIASDITNASDRDFAHHAISNSLKENQPLTSGVDKLLKSWRGATSTMLLKPTATLRNWEQRGNLFGVKGLSVSNVLEALKSAYTKEGKDFAVESGIIKPGSLNDAAEIGLDVNKKGITSKYLKAIGFSATENSNRIASANAGKTLAENLFKVLKSGKDTYKDFARNTLYELGIDVDSALKNGLTRKDLVTAAQRVTEDVNFYSSTWDQPLSWTNSQLTRTAAQFAPSAHQQAQFIGKVAGDVIKYPRKASLNALYLMAFLQVAGELHADVSSAVTGHDRPTNPIARIADNYAHGPGFGLLADAFQSATDSGRLAKMVLGPNFGSFADGLAGVANLAVGKPKPLEKFVAGRVPFIGGALPRLFKSEPTGPKGRPSRPGRTGRGTGR